MLLQLLPSLTTNSNIITPIICTTSIFFHLTFLLVISLTYYYYTHKNTNNNIKTTSHSDKNNLYYRLALFTSLSLSIFSLVLFISGLPLSSSLLSSFLWRFDLGVRSVAWLAVACDLHSRRPPFPLPGPLAASWALFLLLSVSSITLPFILATTKFSLQFWLLHTFSLVSALLLNTLSFFCSKPSINSEFINQPLLNVDESRKDSRSSLFSNAGLISHLTFSWIGPLFAEGRKKPIDLADVPDLHHRDCTNIAFPIFKAKLGEITSSTTSTASYELAKALLLSTWQQVALTALYALVYNVAVYVGPYLIDYLVEYLNDSASSLTKQDYVLISAFIAAKVIECVSQRHWFFRVQQIGLRVRSSLVHLIYHKGLCLSSSARQGCSSGEIINLMSVDAERIGMFSWFMHDLWLVVVQVLLALFILYSVLGIASVAALVATVAVMLANLPVGKFQKKYQEKMMECKDTRMKATSEILRNMRILKLQAWEMKFLSRILELRKIETTWLKKYVHAYAAAVFIFWWAPSFVAVVTFGTCLLIGTPLDAGKILSALATFRVLQEPIYNLPDTLSYALQTKISVERIAAFLCLDELQTDVVDRIPSSDSSGIAVEVCEGCFSWDISSETPTLRQLNFRIVEGSRVAVCGTVGSGKSSLLSCILGEMPRISGSVRIRGRTAYVPQSPWIRSGEIRENILFGDEMDIEKYDRILEACSLKKDLEILPFGDRTVIGERGINLSGGQKQRIQIARALYHDADVYIFDDPFSALDAHTGSHVFKECLLSFLASKTIIYVTHQVEFLPSADLILCMKEGRIVQAGKYNEMLDLGSEFMDLVLAHTHALAPVTSWELFTNNSNTELPHKPEKKDEQNGKLDDTPSNAKGQLIQEEEREKGKVGFRVYWQYITMAYKGALVPVILLTQIFFQALQIGSNYWMAWASPATKGAEPPVSSSVLIYVFVALAVASAFCIFLRALLLMTAGYKTATLMFNKMHTSIFRAPMSFFNSTPSGCILNRASTDQTDVDTSIPFEIGYFAFSVIQLLGIIIVMSQVAWQVFVLFVPVIAISVWYQQYYIATARELSRLVGICKAPLIQHFAESLAGSTTIRSFDKDKEFVAVNSGLMDDFSRTKFHESGAREWLCFRLDMLTSFTFAFFLIFLVSIPRGLIDPGIAGVAVTYGLNLSMLQAIVVWALCNVENKIISVERILQYASISSEPPLIVETNRPDRDWPSKGQVDICDLQVRYAPYMPFVLKGLTCTFPSRAKTGIVGRTGSGKSTLIQTLFRIVDPTVGQIVIDGIDITKIGLHDLRLRLSIIPQEPTMFEGTIRSNLDPLEEYTDEQIWEALDCCQLGDEVRKKELKLYSAVIENGENWSVGQRQLVCLGRVLLKKSKILVLDEATASVDTATDSLIQKTLREQFTESTVITIAHRITSVLDSDMVLLLENGLIVENDAPSRLLENKSSLFARLVSEYSMRSSSSFDQ